MKKLFTLFCAVSLVASAGAVSFVNPQHVPDKARKAFTTSPVELFAIDAPTVPVSEDKATFSVAEDGVITIDNVVAFYLGNYYMIYERCGRMAVAICKRKGFGSIGPSARSGRDAYCGNV